MTSPMSPPVLLPTLATALTVAFAALWLRERSRHRSCERQGRSMRRLALLAECAHDVLLMFDDGGRIVEANSRAVTTYGWSREELLKLDIRRIRAEGSQEELQGQLGRAAAGERFTFETVHRRRDGSEFPVEVSTGSVEFDGRRWILSIVRDVSERKRVEEALRESEAKFREAFYGASMGIALVDPQGVFVEWNDALERMVGYTTEELGRLRFMDLLLPEDRPGSLAAFGAILRGERDHNDMERRYVHKDGRIVHLRYRVAALRDASGRLHRAIGIIEDVTARVEGEAERRQMQAQLALADRMASLGTLAAGVAHEINNPLTYVVANVEVARGALEELAKRHADDDGLGPPLREVGDALGEAAEGTRRVREIVGDLKVLSTSGDESVSQDVDVRAVLQSSINLARRLVTQRAKLVAELGEVAPVSGNAARLGQVFLNLLVNAAQAIPEGDPGEHRVRAACSVDADGRVVVEVSDTGVGIPAGQLGRIFDPFYTTKPQGVGTGLGLAICQSIVSAHDGEIRVDSVEGKGSTFRVLLPVSRAATRSGAREAAPEVPRGRVLVVDDEPFVLRTLERILSPLHEVAVASSAPEALSRIADGVRFDAILCDVMMPGMNGMEFYRELERRFPALVSRVVFVTGGALVDEIRGFLEGVGALVVEKPFAPAQILDAVARTAKG
jgi:PAS domain S-box-containing protein